jgi:molecular chaperone DnaK
MSNSSRAIGIDLGTTNSCVAIIEHNDPLVIPNDEGSRTTPSVVAFTDDNERLVGHIANRQAVTNPDRTLYAVKRLIGRAFADPTVQRTAELVPYDLVEAENGDAWVSVAGHEYSPPQVSAMVLERMRSIAEAYLGEGVTKAIVTVPAYFNDAQRQATKDAGRIAGLDVLRIINEPTAAALAYGMGKKEKERIAVFDLGGGTFDISILEMENGVFMVKATNGDTFLGGEDFDAALMEWLLGGFQEAEGIDLRGDKVAMQRLKEAAEKAKQELSTLDTTDVNLPFIASKEGTPIHLSANIDRATLEGLVEDLVARLDAPCLQCLSDAGLKASELDQVLLVGGMTRMPRIREKVAKIFGQTPNSDVNPDEVVATGAAIQASVLSGEVKDILLLDVTPLTMGIQIAGGIMEPLIPRNTTIPCRKSKVFTTALDNQDLVRVRILQGEREMADDNRDLGTVELSGLPPAPRGVPEIEVTFEIDADGIMNVRAKDLGTSRAQSMRIVSSSGLTADDIEDMITDAETYRAEDRQRREVAEAKNQLDGLIYNTSRTQEEFGDSLEPGARTEVTQALDASEAAMDSTDLAQIQRAHDQLFTSAQALAEAIYGGMQGNIEDFIDDDDDDDDDDDGDDDFDDDDFIDDTDFEADSP